MARKHSGSKITIFSILALLVLVAGGALIISMRFYRMRAWLNSGERFNVGITQRVELPPGDIVIHYESASFLPLIYEQIHCAVRDENGNRLPNRRVAHTEEELQAETFAPSLEFLGNRQTRALWRVNIPASGIYRIRVQNDHEDQDPINDRIVIGKDPQLFSTFTEQNRTMTLSGAMLIGALVIGLYVAHGITLTRRARAAKEDQEVDSAGLPLEDGGGVSTHRGDA